MTKTIGFFAYPSAPYEIGQTIEVATLAISKSSPNIEIKTWKALDIIGHFISSEVLAEINAADFLIADIIHQ